MAAIDMDGVGKVYANGTRAVDDLELHVADGEFSEVQANHILDMPLGVSKRCGV
jgi:hypothetical protein